MGGLLTSYLNRYFECKSITNLAENHSVVSSPMDEFWIYFSRIYFPWWARFQSLNIFFKAIFKHNFNFYFPNQIVVSIGFNEQ